jgi:hypothetical protein
MSILGIITSTEQISELSIATLKQFAEEITCNIETGFIRYSDGRNYYALREEIQNEIERRAYDY